MSNYFKSWSEIKADWKLEKDKPVVFTYKEKLAAILALTILAFSSCQNGDRISKLERQVKQLQRTANEQRN